MVEVAIIGGGIAGAGAAYALARRNISTVIIDENNGRAASGNPVGLIMPWLSLGGGPPRDFHDAAWHYTQQVLKNLDVPILYQGIIQLPPDADEAKRFAQLAAQQVFDETDMQYGDAAQLTQRAGTDITGCGFYLPRAVALSPFDYCAALTAGTARHTATVGAIKLIGQQWQILNAKNQIICEAAHVILATGWQGTLLQQYLPDAIRPRRGQLTYISQNVLPTFNQPIVCGNYLSPPVDGACILGATYQHTTHDDVRDKDHTENLAALQNFTTVPQLAAAAQSITPDMCRGRAAVRATTANHLPIVGPLPGYDNLHVMTGLGSRGLLTAPLLGEILAAQITQTILPVTRQTYTQLSAGRFTRAG